MGLYSTTRSLYWSFVGYPADNYSRLLQASENWPRQGLEDFRNRKIQKLIAHCYENVPYYRRLMEKHKIHPRDIQGAEDLAKLPILTKDTVRTCSSELKASNISKMTVTWTKTGGTTGEPIQVCRNKECSAWQSMCYERGLGWGGLSIDEPRIELFGGSLGLGKTRPTTRIGSMLRRDLFLPAFELRADTAMSYFR